MTLLSLDSSFGRSAEAFALTNTGTIAQKVAANAATSAVRLSKYYLFLKRPIERALALRVFTRKYGCAL